MDAQLDLSDEFKPSQTAVATLLVLSASWIAVDGMPLVPIGLLATLRYVGRNYETTCFASWRKGWRLLAHSAAVSVASWSVFHLAINFYARAGWTGISMSLVTGRLFS
jgi:hypothetical protein